MYNTVLINENESKIEGKKLRTNKRLNTKTKTLQKKRYEKSSIHITVSLKYFFRR